MYHKWYHKWRQQQFALVAQPPHTTNSSSTADQTCQNNLPLATWHMHQYAHLCHDVIIGWAQRALPIAVDTRPARNRGYTGPIKARLDAVTNAHPARKLVSALSHLSRFFELFLIHTHFLTIRAKSKGVSFLASAAVLHESHWLQLSSSCTFTTQRQARFDPTYNVVHKPILLLRFVLPCVPDKQTHSTITKVSLVLH